MGQTMTAPEKKPAAPEGRTETAKILDSAELFEKQKMVLIRHNGDWYRLMVTRQNKLILMK